jgi:hypothetical protein
LTVIILLQQFIVLTFIESGFSFSHPAVAAAEETRRPASLFASRVWCPGCVVCGVWERAEPGAVEKIKIKKKKKKKHVSAANRESKRAKERESKANLSRSLSHISQNSKS